MLFVCFVLLDLFFLCVLIDLNEYMYFCFCISLLTVLFLTFTHYFLITFYSVPFLYVEFTYVYLTCCCSSLVPVVMIFSALDVVPGRPGFFKKW